MADDQYEDLIRHLRALALSQHDDVSIAADAAGAIIALLAERDELAKDAARYRRLRKHAADVWYGDHLIELIDTGRGALDSAIDAEMEGEK